MPQLLVLPKVYRIAATRLDATVRYDSVNMLKKMAFYSPRLSRTMAQALLSDNFEYLSIVLVNETTIQIYFFVVEHPLFDLK